MKKATVFIGCLLMVALVFGVKTEEASAAKSDSKETHLVKSNKIKDTDFFVDAKWVNQHRDDDNTVIIEASYGEGKDFKKGHLPGSVHMDTMEIETEENNWNILPAETSRDAFLTKGVNADSTVIVYGNDINAVGRIAYVAYWLGVKNVKILDGGYDAWTAADYKTEKGNVTPKAASDFGAEVPGRDDTYIETSADLVKAKEANPELIVASTRSWKEFTGKTSGYSYIENAGEPEGAVWAKASKSSSDVAYLTNKDGTMKDPKKLFAAWEKWGITKDSDVAFYCGTGWRNTVVFFLAKQSGFENAKMWDGGWYDWDLAHQSDPSTYPVQVGDPRDADKLVIEN